jgi:hypothetical protein
MDDTMVTYEGTGFLPFMEIVTEQPKTYIKYVLSRKEFSERLGLNPADGEPMDVSISFYDRTVTITMNKTEGT